MTFYLSRSPLIAFANFADSPVPSIVKVLGIDSPNLRHRLELGKRVDLYDPLVISVHLHFDPRILDPSVGNPSGLDFSYLPLFAQFIVDILSTKSSYGNIGRYFMDHSESLPAPY